MQYTKSTFNKRVYFFQQTVQVGNYRYPDLPESQGYIIPLSCSSPLIILHFSSLYNNHLYLGQTPLKNKHPASRRAFLQLSFPLSSIPRLKHYTTWLNISVPYTHRKINPADLKLKKRHKKRKKERKEKKNENLSSTSPTLFKMAAALVQLLRGNVP